MYCYIFQVSSEADVKNALEVCHKKFSRLDALVNCAGIGIAKKVYNPKKNEIHSLKEFERVQRVRFIVINSSFFLNNSIFRLMYLVHSIPYV